MLLSCFLGWWWLVGAGRWVSVARLEAGGFLGYVETLGGVFSGMRVGWCLVLGPGGGGSLFSIRIQQRQFKSEIRIPWPY